MFDIMEISDSSSYLCQLCEDSAPVKCALNEEQSSSADPRCVSFESNNSSYVDVPNSSCLVTGRYSDFFEDYDMYPTILGTGGYGTVRECLHRASGEKYAVKTIDKSKVGRLDHIQREISFLCCIDHPSIMKMVDCYEDADYVHIVTEKYTGGELFDKVLDNTNDHGCLPEEQVVKIIKSLLEAVQYLHDNDIVHRDIKPENVMYEDKTCTSIRLIDFGLSRTHGVYEPAMVNRVGSPYYMSPSVLAGKYDRSCDLWAIGVVAYILLAGYPPFNGHTDEDVHESILRGDLIFEDDVWKNLTWASRHFVGKLLSRDSSRRIENAEDALRHPWMVMA